MQASIQRAAVGQIAGIGDVYDAHTDCFTGFSILKKDVPASAVRLTDNPDTKTEFLTSDTLDDKFSFLDINAELKLSILGGLVNFSGSGSFLQDERKSNRTARCSLIFNIKTKDQRLNLDHEDALNCFALESLRDGSGTHVVTGVQWGANTIVTAEQMTSSETHVRDIKGQFQAQLNMIAVKVSGGASAKYEDKKDRKNDSFSIKVYGDVLPDSSDLPTNYEEAIALMKRMPDLIKKSNNGWGKPLTYVLVPINEIRKRFKLQIMADAVLKEISVQSIVRYTRLFEDFASVKRKLNDIQSEMEGHADVVSEEVRRDVKKAIDSFAVLESNTRKTFARILKQVRSGEADAEEMEEEIASIEVKLSTRTLALSRFEEHKKRMDYVDILKQMPNVVFVGYGKSLSSVLSGFMKEKIYVFYFTDMNEGDEVWTGNRELLNNLLSNESQTKILVVDSVSQGMTSNGPVCRIALLKKGKEAIADMRILRTEADGLCLAACVAGFERTQKKPHKRTNLLLPCPGEDCLSFEKKEWNCQKCQTVLEYGFDGFIYCRCGKGPEMEFGFRCNSKIHGPDFEAFDRTVLKGLLEEHRPIEEMNILILGETGVGKSTWINSFANYMLYETLADAEKGGLVTVIPNSFMFQDTEIKTGDATTNEVMAIGKSATQSSRVYTCRLKDNKLLRIIDTPGVGDVAGIEKDKENFANIMETIANLQELHGILILMKPNEARLTIMFRFCISELLIHLHQSAAHNMIIGFTHTRATFFQPGATKPILSSYLANNMTSCEIELSNQTMYCFDSESYQYLAIINQGIKLPDDMRSDYERSWDRSVRETKRLLDHVKTLVPHKVHDTCSLNDVRTLILQLTTPLAEITRLIQQNVERSQKQVQELVETKKHGKELEKDMKITMIGLVPETIDYPRTVCTDQSCVTYETYNDIRKANYTTTCHDHCYLNGIPVNTANDARLASCTAMAGKTNCQNCGHHYTLHMHVTYVYKSEEIQVEDENKKKLLHHNKTEEERKEAAIAELLKRIDEYKQAEREVAKAAALFGCFLKKNAIIAVNDARLQYLDHMIREENAKLDKTAAEMQVIERLEAAKRTHVSEMKIIEDTIAHGEGKELLEPTAVKALIDKLYRMKHFGVMIKKIGTVSVNASRHQYAEHQIPVHKPKGGTSGRGFIDGLKNAGNWVAKGIGLA